MGRGDGGRWRQGAVTGLALATLVAAGMSAAWGQDVPARVVDGYGRQVPLAMALRSVVPLGTPVEIDPALPDGVERTTLVTWYGGADWRRVLADALGPAGFEYVPWGRGVLIARQGEGEEALRRKPVPVTAPTPREAVALGLVTPSPAATGTAGMPAPKAATGGQVATTAEPKPGPPVSLRVPPPSAAISPLPISPAMTPPLPSPPAAKGPGIAGGAMTTGTAGGRGDGAGGGGEWVALTGASLEATLVAWAARAPCTTGDAAFWRVDYPSLKGSYPIKFGHRFRGEFVDVVVHFVNAFARATPAPRAEVNRTMCTVRVTIPERS